jgi:hypothetical protein
MSSNDGKQVATQISFGWLRWTHKALKMPLSAPKKVTVGR